MIPTAPLQLFNLSRLIRLWLLPIAFFIISLQISGKTKNIFNINLHKGIRSNLVYTSLVDKNGYLWFATNYGVARYNGYEIKIFTTYDGLPVDDVWQLVEDSKGRIWLGCIANKFGYIYNDKYHDVKFADSQHNTIYPINMRSFNGSIVFYCTYNVEHNNSVLYVERNDTLFRKNVSDEFYKKYFNNNNAEKNSYTAFFNEKGKPLIFHKNRCYEYSIEKDKINFNLISSTTDSGFVTAWGENGNLFLGNKLFLFYTVVPRKCFKTLDITTGKTTTVNLQQYGVDENIAYSNYISSNNPDNIFYVFTQHWTLKFSVQDSLRFISRQNIQDFTNDISNSGEKLLSVNENPTWGVITTSSSSGLNIKYDNDTFFEKTKLDLDDYKLINNEKSAYSFWISSTNSSLLVIDRYGNNKTLKLPLSSVIYSTKKLDSVNYLLLGAHHYTYNVKTKKVSLSDSFSKLGSGSFSAIPYKGSTWLCISNRGCYTIDLSQSNPAENTIDRDRFRNVVYDSTRKHYWIYNRNKVITYSNGTATTIPVRSLGVERVEKIIIDQAYGNTFLLGNGQLAIYDPGSRSYRHILASINLKDASINVVNNVLVVCGQFGLIFCNIYGPGKLSVPMIYRNIKNSYYEYVYDVHAFSGHLLLNTSHGVYTVAMPDTTYNARFDLTTVMQHAKLLCNYNNKITILGIQDTLKVDPQNANIKFDLINPGGNGDIKFLIKFQNSGFTEISGKEYTLTNITPDNYYLLTIQPTDNIWKKEPTTLVIYVEPQWYQTKTMIRIMWVSLVIALLLLVALSVLITRRLVLRATKKRQARMELELKSIYAQINPHFIFNSLNSALLLVSKNKMDEAYGHISKFSRLLRSYIKSSRNKYIVLADEIKNLTNYIDLQQVRFKDKFDYHITVADGIDTVNTMLPSLLLQPFVENAIEHGLLGKEEKGTLNITFKLDDSSGKLLCIIDDDGIGRQESKQNKVPNPIKDESYGELLIKDLVSIFNKYEHMNILVKYADKVSPQKGTIVTIEISVH